MIIIDAIIVITNALHVDDLASHTLLLFPE